MTTLCLCDWVESDQRHPLRAALEAPAGSGQEDLTDSNTKHEGVACLAIPLIPVIQEYAS